MIRKWQRFQDLSLDDLYEIMVIRQKVFAVEQNIVYLDADGKDRASWHLSFWQGDSIATYLRVLPAREKYAEVAIGRVATATEARGKGIGKDLMREALTRIQSELGPSPIRISAQSYLEKFYQDFGFATVGEPYIEEGILHIEMLRP